MDKKVLKEWLEYTNYLCKNLSEEEIKKLTEIFVKSSLYELDFWNMAYEEVSKDDI